VKAVFYTTTFDDTPVEKIVEALNDMSGIIMGHPVFHDTVEASQSSSRSTGFNGPIKTWTITIDDGVTQ
jgi:hypothetical protein